MPDEKKKLPYKFVEVEWLDAIGGTDDQWIVEEDLPKPVTITTRGWLVKEEIEYVSLAGSFYYYESEPVYGEFLTVPYGMIQSLRELPDA